MGTIEELRIHPFLSDPEMFESENISAEHISEAINYRNLDKDGWAG